MVVKRAAKKAVKRQKKTAHESEAAGPVSLEELREKVRKVVAEKIDDMTHAAADEAAKGHVAQLKYLFEVIGLFPATEGEKPEPEYGNDLAKTLLDRFHFPASLSAEEEADEEIAVLAGAGNDSVE
jgi:hypothetical protein